MKRNILIVVAAIIAVGGAVFAIDRMQTPEPITPNLPDNVQEPNQYATWQTVEMGNVELKIPPGYTMDAGAGNRYIVKDDPNNPSPTPDMHISSDGQQINFRRWEGNAWQYYDQVIASIRIKTPLTNNLQINIDK